MGAEAFQDRIPHNGCFGCGPENAGGLRLKSYWAEGGGEAVSQFLPQPHMSAGPPQYLNGGIIATIIDCHAVCTAIADAYRREGRAIGEGDVIWYVTGRLDVSYRQPVPIDEPVQLRAAVASTTATKSIVSCRLLSGGQLCATAEVVAVRVPPGWLGA